jgi:hypothetical protein
MFSSLMFNGSWLLAALVILAVAVLLLILAWRAFLVTLALIVVSVFIWNLDLSTHTANARRLGDQYLLFSVDQVHLAHFGLGLLSGLVVFSTLFFVRAFARVALVAGSVAIALILFTEGVAGLMRYAAILLQFVKEFDFFIKGLVVGKLCVGLMKWKQVRHRKELSTASSR